MFYGNPVTKPRVFHHVTFIKHFAVQILPLFLVKTPVCVIPWFREEGGKIQGTRGKAKHRTHGLVPSLYEKQGMSMSE